MSRQWVLVASGIFQKGQLQMSSCSGWQTMLQRTAHSPLSNTLETSGVRRPPLSFVQRGCTGHLPLTSFMQWNFYWWLIISWMLAMPRRPKTPWYFSSDASWISVTGSHCQLHWGSSWTNWHKNQLAISLLFSHFICLLFWTIFLDCRLHSIFNTNQKLFCF